MGIFNREGRKGREDDEVMREFRHPLPGVLDFL
jgi:hypothetical protein